MDYEERQREVERIRSVILRSRGITPEGLRQYVAGASDDLRRDIYALFWRMGTTGPEPRPSQAIVTLMLQQTPVEKPVLRDQLLKWLQDFRQEDFDGQSRRALRNLPWTHEYAPPAIRLVGIAEMRETIFRLMAEVREAPLPSHPPAGYQATNTWAAMLALARMGDKESLDRVIRQVQSEPNIVLRASLLLKDLGYTRRPAAFDALRGYLNGDQRLPPIERGVRPRLEACYAAAVFSKYVKGFPIQETDFNESQVMTARAWVNAQKEWRFQ